MKWKIHRCNCRKVWAIQSRKSKITANTILLNGNWLTQLKPEGSCNPRGFVTTLKSNEIILNPATELVEQFVKVPKLIYDKRNANFNQNKG